jgi:hypothetical protein
VGNRQGAESEYASIYTNSPARRPGRVFIDASVVTRPDSLNPLSVSPYGVELNRLGSLDTDSVELTFANRSERYLTLTLVSPPRDEFDVSFPESLGPYEQAVGYVKLTNDFSSTEFEYSVTVEMRDPDDFRRRLTIPVGRHFLGK